MIEGRKLAKFFLFVLPMTGILVILSRIDIGPEVFSPVAHLLDDSMINMRVAANFWKHSVPYFNLSEPVAANTSLFWPMIISPVFILPDYRFIPVIFLSILSAAIYAVIAFYFARATEGRLQKVLLIGLICFSGSGLYYAASGWEHIPQLMFTSLGFLLIAQNKDDELGIFILGFYFICFSFIIRPDVLIIITVMFFGIILLVKKNYINKFVIYSAPLLIIPFIYLILMYYYYDDFVPNTYYLKATGIKDKMILGITYISNPSKSGFVPITLMFLLIVWRRLENREKIILAASIAHISLIVSAGGDVFEYGRFFLVLLPITAFLMVKRLHMAVTLVVIGVFCLYPAYKILSAKILSAPSTLEILSSNQLGLASIINQSLSPEDGSIALHALGIAYHLPQFHVVDLLGKAEPYIARQSAKNSVIGHNKWDNEYVLNKYNIAVMPMTHAAYELSFKLSRRDYIHKGYAFVIDAAKSFRANGNYRYIAPGDFCFPSQMGIFVRKDLLAKFTSHSCVSPETTAIGN